jgi:catechol 2,3-dioxygenase
LIAPPSIAMIEFMAREIDRRVDIGHVHLKVSDLERAVAFYHGVLGFAVTQRMGDSAAFLSAGGYHHHIGLNTWDSLGGPAPAPGTTGLYHVAIRYPDRAALGDALRRLEAARIPLDGASDHGVSEALYLRDPDGNGLELYWDRPRDDWPREADGSLRMVTERLDLAGVRAAAAAPPVGDAPARSTPSPAAMSTDARSKLRDVRTRLLHLHQVLLEDARAAYELDRGRVGSPGKLLQLVINDPWFAWLHALSELVVRIDQTIEESTSTEAEAAALLDQVGRLLTASEHGDGFARRYFEALQRQPAVVLAHADVRRALKGTRPAN